MNKTAIAVMLVSSVAATTAQAGPRWHADPQPSYWDHARVISAIPVVRQVQISSPRRECWQEEVHQPVTVQHGPSRASSTLVGAIIGGVIGNQFGGGSGKKLATAAGTMLGASLGNDAARAREHYSTYDRVSQQTRCATQVEYHTEERIEGYDVTYRYRGQTFTTRMPYDPGKKLRLRVNLRPE